MRLFEAIIAANHQAAAGDANAGLRPADFADALPVAALTCFDARLNPLLPEVLGIPEEWFIWLRNAGNVVTHSTSSTVRSLALACAVKGAREICVIGHTDCQICRTSTMQLLERLKSLGVQRQLLPDNVNEFFNVFSSERQNVIKACEVVRSSHLIGPQIPVHGLLLDTSTGRLEWLVNGYQNWTAPDATGSEMLRSAGETVDKLKSLAEFQFGEMKFPETKIGEFVAQAGDWLSDKIETRSTATESTATPNPAQPTTPVAAAAAKLVAAAKVVLAQPPQSPAQAGPKPIPLPPKIPPRIQAPKSKFFRLK